MNENIEPKKDSTLKHDNQKNPTKEELTEHDILELMGVFKDKYHRVNRRVKKQ